VQGDRARLRSINRIGLERAGFTSAEINEIRGIFKMLFVSNEILEKRISDVEVRYPNSLYAKRFIDFIRTSERGVVRRSKRN